MVIESARRAAGQLFAPEFRSVLWKSLGLTILLLLVAWIALEAVISTFLAPFLGPWPWLATALVWLMGTGMFIGAIFLVAPVSAMFAGVFLDDVALAVEQRNYPGDRPGTPMAMMPSIWLAVKFTVLVVAANLLALLLVLLPGINFAIFFLLNGYLVGREYFQFAAMRFRSEKDAETLRLANSGIVFMAGLVIAGFMAVPILNLATPVFAAAMMVHLHKGLSQRDPDRSRPGMRVAA
ncbi:MAG: sulfate transporter family protein [Nitratireductor sp.]|nr:sulfate transporter family protein [Nitratireductor sp.]MCB1459199.1 sulfate transporter family protein [Nitratireductor sp.]